MLFVLLPDIEILSCYYFRAYIRLHSEPVCPVPIIESIPDTDCPMETTLHPENINVIYGLKRKLIHFHVLTFTRS